MHVSLLISLSDRFCIRCHCPLPWIGYRCNRKLDCLQHDDVLGYTTNESMCELDLNLTAVTDLYMACSCPMIGSFNLLGVEAAQERTHTS